ncbi:MAG: cysteine--tRNA ligase, partial [Sphingomonadales bacterium]
AGLVARGHAYVAEGHVLFDVASDADYGSLSRRSLDEMIAGARVEVAPYKRNGADFVLWKPSTPEQAGWDSPWGRGRPGWHIECSAMIAKSLGETIDIHGGGIDLTFPHHENECAQSRCSHGKPLANIWMHNGFLNFGGAEKMSKSLGNVVTVPDLLAQGWHGEVLRLALLSAHYRQPLEWTADLLAETKARYTRWQKMVDGGTEQGVPDAEFLAALQDDINTPKALAALSRLDKKGDAVSLSASLHLLGFTMPRIWENDPAIQALVEARTAARTAKNWAESDRIRVELAAQGIVLEDGPGGTTWRRG